MDKLTAIKIKYDDGTYSDEIPVSVLSENVEWDNTHTLVDVLGSIDVDITGTIQDQISRLFNEKVSNAAMQDYVSNNMNTYITDWLNKNVNPVGSAVVVDNTLTIEGAAADAKKTGNKITDLNNIILGNEDNFNINTGTDFGQHITYHLQKGQRYKFTIISPSRTQGRVMFMTEQTWSATDLVYNFQWSSTNLSFEYQPNVNTIQYIGVRSMSTSTTGLTATLSISVSSLNNTVDALNNTVDALNHSLGAVCVSPLEPGGLISSTQEDNNLSYLLQRARTPILSPMILSAGDIISLTDKITYRYHVFSETTNTDWLSEEYTIPVTGKYWIEIRRQDQANASVEELQRHIVLKSLLGGYIQNKIENFNNSIFNLEEETGYKEAFTINTKNSFGQHIPYHLLPNISYTFDIISPNHSDGRIMLLTKQNWSYDSMIANFQWSSSEKTFTYIPETDTIMYIGVRSMSTSTTGLTATLKIKMSGKMDIRITNLENKMPEELPNYYYENDYLPNKLLAINNSLNYENGIAFAFITDIHFPNNRYKSKLLLKELLSKTNIPFVIFGGDIPNLFGDEAQLQKDIEDLISYMDTVGRQNWYAIHGNHDLYNRTNETPTTTYKKTRAEMYNIMMRTSERYVTNMFPEHACYCIDIPAQKTRIVMLNSSDNTIGGGAYTTAQLQWLIKRITEIENTNFIFVSHIPSDPVLAGSEASVGQNVQAILEALKNRSTVTIAGVEYSFVSTTNNMICHINGHMHEDTYHMNNNVFSVVTTCDAAYQDDGEGYAANTIAEQAIDVYFINYDNHTLKTIRLGRGVDRSWNYEDGSVLL